MYGSQALRIGNLPPGIPPSIDLTISRTRAGQICSREVLHLHMVTPQFPFTPPGQEKKKKKTTGKIIHMSIPSAYLVIQDEKRD